MDFMGDPPPAPTERFLEWEDSGNLYRIPHCDIEHIYTIPEKQDYEEYGFSCLLPVENGASLRFFYDPMGVKLGESPYALHLMIPIGVDPVDGDTNNAPAVIIDGVIHLAHEGCKGDRCRGCPGFGTLEEVECARDVLRRMRELGSLEVRAPISLPDGD